MDRLGITLEVLNDLPARGNPTGTILQAWNTVKSIFARKDAMPINEFFDTGERALLKAYRYALRQADIMPSCRKLITRQKAELSAFYRQYRQLYRSHDLRGILLSSTL